MLDGFQPIRLDALPGIDPAFLNVAQLSRDQAPKIWIHRVERRSTRLDLRPVQFAIPLFESSVLELALHAVAGWLVH